MPIYMKFTKKNGTVIKGDVTDADHQGWIELHSAQLGVNRHITNPSGRGTNREAAAPSVQEIVVTKDQDSASNDLFRHGLWGEGAKVEIDFVKREGDKSVTYMSITLENTLVSSFQLSGSGGDANARPMESMSLNFTNIEYSTEGPGRLIPGAKSTPEHPGDAKPRVKGRTK